MIDWSNVRASYLGEKSQRQLLPDIRLPVLPSAVSEFSAAAESPSCRIQDLSAIVERDSGLTWQLLKNVNASANGLRHRVTSAQHAISCLGIRRTKVFLISAALQSALPVRKLKLINLASFWNTNLERAHFARFMAGLLKTDQELAFAAALLEDFLLPFLTNELEEQYAEFFRQQETQPGNLIDFERQVFNWDHAEVGARVMFDWDFPDELICCLLFHHHGLPMLSDQTLNRSPAAAVALSGLMPDSIRQCPAGLSQLVQLSEMWAAFDLSKAAEQVYQKTRREMHNADSHISFRARCTRLYEPVEA